MDSTLPMNLKSVLPSGASQVKATKQLCWANLDIGRYITFTKCHSSVHAKKTKQHAAVNSFAVKFQNLYSGFGHNAFGILSSK